MATATTGSGGCGWGAALAAKTAATITTLSMKDNNVDLGTFATTKRRMLFNLNASFRRVKAAVKVIVNIGAATLHKTASHRLYMEESVLLSQQDTFSISEAPRQFLEQGRLPNFPKSRNPQQGLELYPNRLLLSK